MSINLFLEKLLVIILIIYYSNVDDLNPTDKAKGVLSSPPMTLENFNKLSEKLDLMEKNRKADNERYEKNRKADNEKYEKNRNADKKFIYDLVKGRQHDIQSEAASFLFNTSVAIFDNKTMKFNSGHYIYHDEKFLLLTVSHGVQIEDSYECHADIDVQISGGCPVNSAINVSDWASLRIGDQASTFGFVNENDLFIPRFWKGSLAGNLGYLHTHRESNTHFLADEYIFQGVAQLMGMSGGPTINGNGYTGMVHGNNNYLNLSISTACVIPFSLIKSKCIDKMPFERPDLFKLLKTASDCTYVKIINAPQF